jgi:ABC-type sugar transport system ATPase subunit
MGRAIVREPAAFLMDEPLSNLDAKLRVQMRSELGLLHSRLKTTTLYVTHDQVEAMTMGDRVAVIRKGALQQVDTPRGLYDQPDNLFVGGFIGSPSMNFVIAALSSSNGSTYVELAGKSYWDCVPRASRSKLRRPAPTLKPSWPSMSIWSSSWARKLTCTSTCRCRR